MNYSITVPITLFNRLKKDQSTVNKLKEIAASVQDPEQFYLQCVKILEVNTKLEEKLIKKQNESTK